MTDQGPVWLKRTLRRHLARMEPAQAVAMAQTLLDEARARQKAVPPLILRPEDRVPPPYRLLPCQRVDRGPQSRSERV